MIKGTIAHEKFYFPTGEMHIKLNYFLNQYLAKHFVDILFEFERNEEILELLLYCDTVKRNNGTIKTIRIPYIPFSRQDRIKFKGDCFSLSVFCELINSIGAEEVVIECPHSDVVTALIKNCTYINLSKETLNVFLKGEKYFLVCPDAGALKRTYKIASMFPDKVIGVIECSKNRNVKTGEITGLEVHYKKSLKDQPVIIFDDICDGGEIFVEIAKKLKKLNPKKITLVVAHGFFTKGVSVFNNIIDEVYTRKGRIK